VLLGAPASKEQPEALLLLVFIMSRLSCRPWSFANAYLLDAYGIDEVGQVVPDNVVEFSGGNEWCMQAPRTRGC
jgi:hypothetical protein